MAFGLLDKVKMEFAVRGIACRRKRYVEVVARYFEDGSVRPLSIEWDDGRVFHIDQVIDVRQAASLKVGGMGTRFIVRIGEHTTCLFFENPRWFVEEIIPDGQVAGPGDTSCSEAWDEQELSTWFPAMQVPEM